MFVTAVCFWSLTWDYLFSVSAIFVYFCLVHSFSGDTLPDCLALAVSPVFMFNMCCLTSSSLPLQWSCLTTCLFCPLIVGFFLTKPTFVPTSFKRKSHSGCHPFKLKQQYVTLTATRVFEKQNLRDVTQNSHFREAGSYFTKGMSSGFPSNILWLLCLNSVIHGGSWKQHAGCLQTEAAAAAPGRCCGQLR